MNRGFSESNDRREWFVKGPIGGIAFWVAEMPSGIRLHSQDRFFGGVEYHYAAKPKWSRNNPDHEDCKITGGNCWHDGTSLWASEHWIPNVLPLGDEAIYSALESAYRQVERDTAEEGELL